MKYHLRLIIQALLFFSLFTQFVAGCRVISLEEEIAPTYQFRQKEAVVPDLTPFVTDGVSPTGSGGVRAETVEAIEAEATELPEPEPTPAQMVRLEPTVRATDSADSSTLIPRMVENPARLRVSEGVYVRLGPGVLYPSHGYLLKGQTVSIIGRADNGTDPFLWWKVDCPDTAYHADCWVSGGDRYVELESAEEVPVIAVPQGVLVYVDRGDLWIGTVVAPESAELSALSQVTFHGDVTQFAISPDGYKLAYLREGKQSDTLMILNLSLGDPIVLSNAFRVGQFAWAADSLGVVFNTKSADNQPNNDLWYLRLTENTPQELLKAGQGGAVFTINLRDQLLLASNTRVYSYQLGQANSLRSLFAYTQPDDVALPTLYPTFAWREGGEEAFVNLINSKEETELWAVTFSGKKVEARRWNTIPDLGTGNAVLWSSTGDYAYTQFGELYFAKAYRKGSLVSDTTPNRPLLLAWSKDGSKLLYSLSADDGVKLIVAQKDGQPIATMPFKVGTRFLQAEWIDETLFTVISEEKGVPTLSYGDVGSGLYPLAIGQKNQPLPLTVWPLNPVFLNGAFPSTNPTDQ